MGVPQCGFNRTLSSEPLIHFEPDACPCFYEMIVGEAPYQNPNVINIGPDTKAMRIALGKRWLANPRCDAYCLCESWD